MARKRKSGPRERAISIDGAFLDSRVTGLSDRQYRVLFILERHAETGPYCRLRSEELARAAGKTGAQTRAILAELEAGGWITRVYNGDAFRPIGFVLHRRCDSDLPAWERGRPLAEAATLILSEGDDDKP
jgi:hypothetical protein